MGRENDFAKAREIAPCACEPCWTDREMHAPDCLWDNCGEEIADALNAAREEGRILGPSTVSAGRGYRPCAECPHGPVTHAGCPEECPPGFAHTEEGTVGNDLRVVFDSLAALSSSVEKFVSVSRVFSHDHPEVWAARSEMIRCRLYAQRVLLANTRWRKEAR